MATKKGFIDLISLVLAGGLCSSLAAGIDTIRPGDQLNASDHLVSAKEIFTLGFFGLQDSNNSYLGIWYTEDYTIRVWVANRDKPIFNNSGVLAIDTTGKLMIKTEGGDLIPLNSDQGTTTGNVNATLKDSGNFVVADEKRVLWQSFDYPTDTLLPGMKLGVDLKTGRNWTLTSSLSSDVLASGAFTLSWEPTQDSGQLVIRRRGMLYWTSGLLIDQSFKFMPELDLTGADVYRVKLRYESNEHEKYLTISPMKELIDVRYPHRSRWILDPEAKILDGSFFILNNLTNFCYGYETDSYSGCATARLPSCRRPNDKFDERSGSFNGLAAPTVDDNPSLSLSDCWAKCWNDCSCRGFDNLVNSNGTGCQLYIGNFTFEQDYTGDSRVTHYVLVPGSSAKGQCNFISISQESYFIRKSRS
ncbi:hypothetical protein L1049_009456 [Liquidambar formosana]|uniref:non-specific serine/threonine protein kinase n=1 Tax=Liquidambar formosana TaxID=63359 RepID=A0AAP0S7V4_LIQFO